MFIGAWIYSVRSLKGMHKVIIDENRRHNELLTKIIERTDDRIARLENAESERGQQTQ